MKNIYLEIKNELAFALYAVRKNFSNNAELRSSFIINVVGMAINNGAFVLLWVSFALTVGEVNGWGAADVVGLLGFGTLSFGIVFTVCSGIRNTPEYVMSGSFDRFLLSPKNVIMRLATSQLNTSAIGDAVFGVICLVVYAFLIKATAVQAVLITISILVASLMWLSAAIAINSISFYFTDSRSVVGGIFDLFLTPTLFHGGAFQGVMRIAFLIFIPALVIGAFPVEIVRDISLAKLALIIVISLTWFAISLTLFYKGVKKYESANFMTFGS